MDRRHAVFFAALVLAGAIFFWLRLGENERPISQAKPETNIAAEKNSVPAVEGNSPADRIAAMLAKLRRGGATAADLAELKRELFANPAAGIDAIRRFLETHEDAATGQHFTVGHDGVLDGAPTLRIFLLDLLGQLSRTTGSKAGAELAREILAAKDSPDEWALALRNLAWGDPQSRELLAEKMHEMLSYDPWIATPTSGMLEAFDVAVFTGDASFIPAFSALTHGGNSALQRAATVALDRLAENSPVATMQFLNAHPDTISDLPFVRADYFAKADLGDSQQRQSVEAYLDREDVGAQEKTKFFHAIAAPGSFVSDSLLSTSAPPDNAAARYSAIAAATAEWTRANRFPALEEQVRWLHQRVTSGP